MKPVVMPDEFDFYSNINTLMKGEMYHAVRHGETFLITLKDGSGNWTETVKKTYHYLKHDDWVIKFA